MGGKRQRVPRDGIDVVPSGVVDSVSEPEKKRKRVEGTGDVPLRCELCSVSFNSSFQLDAHKAGKKHAKVARGRDGGTSVVNRACNVRKQQQAELLSRLGSTSLQERKKELKQTFARAQVGLAEVKVVTPKRRKGAASTEDQELSDSEDYNVLRKNAKKALREMSRIERQRLKKRMKRRKKRVEEKELLQEGKKPSGSPASSLPAAPVALPTRVKSQLRELNEPSLPDTAEGDQSAQTARIDDQSTKKEKPKRATKKERAVKTDPVVTCWSELFSSCTRITKSLSGCKAFSDSNVPSGCCSACGEVADKHSLRPMLRRKYLEAMPKLSFATVFSSGSSQEELAAGGDFVGLVLYCTQLLRDLRLTLTDLNHLSWAMTLLEKVYDAGAKLQALAPGLPESFREKAQEVVGAISGELGEAMMLLGSCEDTSLTHAVRVEGVCHVDEAYFGLYYHWSTWMEGCLRRDPSRQMIREALQPLSWFGHIVAARNWLTSTTMEERRRAFWEEEVRVTADDLRELEERLWKGSNSLLQLYLMHWDDTVQLFGPRSPMDDGAMKKLSSKLQRKSCGAAEAITAERSSREPPCPPILEKWRSTCKSWFCRIYAFAVPNDAALSAMLATLSNLAEQSHATPTLVEVGAGTGYWCHLVSQCCRLEGHSVSVIATDIAPCPVSSLACAQAVVAKSKEKTTTRNDYHGQCVGFVPVQPGGAALLDVELSRAPASTALFLCYPPPNSLMAEKCLDQVVRHKGSCVIVVGEWQGDTATGQFERTLARKFCLTSAVALPNWMDTANSLTIWTSAQSREWPAEELQGSSVGRVLLQAAGDAFTACSTCGEPASCRRCTYCAKVRYCSIPCMEKGLATHRGLHKAHFLGAEQILDTLCTRWQSAEWQQLRMLS